MSGRGGTYCYFRKGATGKSSAQVIYISRQPAVTDRERGVLLRNLPEEVREARDYDELRSNLAAYAWAREEGELARHHGPGEPRTHFRATLSFEHDLETERALGMADEWLRESFPAARAAAFVHRDTDHTHVHVWIDARQTDGRKIDLAPSEYRSLDERWNRIYAREFGRDEREHLEKKQETLEYKRALARGEEREPPGRAEQKRREDFEEREKRNAGAHEHDETRARRDQSAITDRGRPPAPAERGAERGERALEFAIDAAGGAISEVAGLREDLARLGERGHDVDLSRGLDR